MNKLPINVASRFVYSLILNIISVHLCLDANFVSLNTLHTFLKNIPPLTLPSPTENPSTFAYIAQKFAICATRVDACSLLIPFILNDSTCVVVGGVSLFCTFSWFLVLALFVFWSSCKDKDSAGLLFVSWFSFSFSASFSFFPGAVVFMLLGEVLLLNVTLFILVTFALLSPRHISNKNIFGIVNK